MGVLQSTIGGVRTLFGELRAVISRYQRVQARVQADPGLPVSNPSRSFWMHPHARLPRSELPVYADVVILGSGITAASVARTLHAEQPGISVVVLDARDACGGATGRNGGHLKPYLYEEYSAIKRKYGESEAKKIIRFRQMHVAETIRIAAEEGVLEAAGAREVESLDVHFSAEVFEAHRKRFEEWQRDCPEESRGYKLHEADEARSKFHLADHCQGVIVGPAGAVHPYKLITAIWKRLLTEHGDRFSLCTHTPCIQISPPSESLSSVYTVHTPRGQIVTPHVVHATNAYISHLLPKMRGKIIPARATCTAQRPGRGCTPSTADGGRSWMLYHARGYDYLTQLPTDAEGYAGELIFGGGFIHAEDGVGEVGRADDSAMHPVIGAYLGGALPTLFGPMNWGPEEYVDDREAAEDIADGWSADRVKALWTGILSASADGLPWVGRVPPKVAQRPAPKRPDGKAGNLTTVEPGEWIAAGYSGDGMSSALLSGRAVAYMIMGKEDEHKVREWLPESFVITQKRWAKARAENLLSETRVPGLTK
ncbi:nucleotide-binding domain-containing protein [Auricularia subglabra TFB-10046 SS5]|nr:nucleotide-binding domain-containing protein [Auricularia subglabra TFB-10046 SS5]